MPRSANRPGYEVTTWYSFVTPPHAADAIDRLSKESPRS